MEMVAEGAIREADQPGVMEVAHTFTAIVEGKEAARVDNNFFLVNVPIGSLESHTFCSKFPRVSHTPPPVLPLPLTHVLLATGDDSSQPHASCLGSLTD